MPSIPAVLTACRTATASNQPQRRRLSGDGAELAAAVAEGLADRVGQLGRERAAADPGRVGLGDAEHKADRRRRDAGPGRGLPGHRVRRGHVGIGAVIDIEHRALRALEQDAAAGAPRLVEQPPDRRGVGQELRRDLAQPGQHVGAVELRRVEPAQQRVVVQQQIVDPVFERLRLGQIADPHRAAADLVLVGRADAAAGRADPPRAAPLLARPVERAVRRQDQRRIVGEPQRLAAKSPAPCRASSRSRRAAPRDRRRRRCR